MWFLLFLMTREEKQSLTWWIQNIVYFQSEDWTSIPAVCFY